MHLNNKKYSSIRPLVIDNRIHRSQLFYRSFPFLPNTHTHTHTHTHSPQSTSGIIVGTSVGAFVFVLLLLFILFVVIFISKSKSKTKLEKMPSKTLDGDPFDRSKEDMNYIPIRVNEAYATTDFTQGNVAYSVAVANSDNEYVEYAYII